jgi:hypothetical protein
VHKRILALISILILVGSMSLTFPVSAAGKRTQLFIDGVWTTVTPRGASEVQITRGRKNERQRVAPTGMSCVLDNRDGNLSNRNAASPYFGKLGKNIQMRQVIDGLSFMKTIGANSYSSTADHSSLDITGDIDIRIDLALDDWTDVGLAGKLNPTGNQRSWAFYLGTLKQPILLWSADGIADTGVIQSANPITTGDGERVTLRVTLDVNNGSGSKVITFYTGSSVDGPWTTLDTQTIASTTSIFASTAVLTVGGLPLLGPLWSEGKIYRFQLYNGIGGTLVADPKFEDMTSNMAIIDSLGRLWGLNGCQFVPNSVRCVVEVPFMGQRWDTTGNDMYVPVQGSGILRRLGQGQRPLRSAIWRENLFGSNALAFWPMNEGSNATSIASALPNGAPMSLDVIGGFASQQINSWTEPMMTVTTDQSLTIEGRVNQSVSATEWTGDFTYSFSADADVADLSVEWGGSGAGNPASPKVYWLLTLLDNAPNLDYELSVIEFTGSASSQTLLTSGSLDHLDGRVHHARVTTDNNGANTTWSLLIDNTTLDSGSTASPWDPMFYTLVDANANVGTVSIGMMAAWNAASGPTNAANAAVVGRSGELGGNRFIRLCAEENIEYETFGDLNLTEPMGPQKIDTLLNNLYDIEDVDHGVLDEPRFFLGLRYQTRVSLYDSNNTAVELDYALKHLSKELADNDDDSFLRNDVEISRPEGSSYRTIQETGPNNIQDPTVDTQGVGLYDESTQINMDGDYQLSNIAEWRKHLGTFDEQARFSAINVELHRSVFVNDPQLTINIAELDTGSYFRVLNPKHPPLAPEDLELIIDSYGEIIGNLTWELAFNSNPSGRYRVGVYNDSGSRYSTSRSVLNEALDTTETDITIVIIDRGAFWVVGNSAPQFPFDIMLGGERMTVTEIAAPSGQSQVMTVIRSVNGIVKSHANGIDGPELFQPRRYGF